MCAIPFEQFLISLPQIRLAIFLRELAGALRGGEGGVKISRLGLRRRERADENSFFKVRQLAGALRELDGARAIADLCARVGRKRPREIVQRLDAIGIKPQGFVQLKIRFVGAALAGEVFSADFFGGVTDADFFFITRSVPCRVTIASPGHTLIATCGRSKAFL